jgi:hypothetical protein
MSIPVYYKTNFSLMQHHKYSLADINDMYPYERDVYVALLIEHLQEINKKNG